MEWVEDPSPAMQQMAAALARQAVEANPRNVHAWHRLAETTRTSGEPRAALNIVASALTYVPDDPRLLQCKARAAHMIGDYRLALAAIDRVLALSPGAGGVRSLRCDILFRLQDVAAGIEALAALAADPGEANSCFELKARLLRTRAQHDELLAHCDAHLTRHPGHTSAVFFKTLALLHLDRETEANALLAFDRFVQLSALDDTIGPEARAAIAAEISSNPTLGPDPSGKSIRDGLQTRHLRQSGAPAVDTLLRRIRTAVESYVGRLAGDAHPFARACPARARLSAWAVVYSAAGRQQVHHHASGWLSGVFYVAAPRVGDAFSGSLLLGPLTVVNQQPVRHPGTQDIEPVPGRLVMFPSYMPHATLPPRDDNGRIAVSFDVIPAVADSHDAMDD